MTDDHVTEMRQKAVEALVGRKIIAIAFDEKPIERTAPPSTDTSIVLFLDDMHKVEISASAGQCIEYDVDLDVWVSDAEPFLPSELLRPPDDVTIVDG